MKLLFFTFLYLLVINNINSQVVDLDRILFSNNDKLNSLSVLNKSDYINHINNSTVKTFEFINYSASSDFLVNIIYPDSLTEVIFYYYNKKTSQNIQQILAKLPKDKIKKIQLFYCEVSDFPNEIWEFKNLTELDLYHSSFDRVTLIKKLNISNVYLSNTRFKKETILPYIDSVSILRFENWKNIYSYQKEITRLSTLTYLSFKNCSLREFPYFVTKLKKLTQLDLSNNKIRRIPYFVRDYSNIKIINLSDNPISLRLCMNEFEFEGVTYWGNPCNSSRRYRNRIRKLNKEY